MNRRRPLLGLDPVLLTTAQRRYTGAGVDGIPKLGQPTGETTKVVERMALW